MHTAFLFSMHTRFLFFMHTLFLVRRATVPHPPYGADGPPGRRCLIPSQAGRRYDAMWAAWRGTAGPGDDRPGDGRARL
jgi:hypothetical protein